MWAEEGIQEFVWSGFSYAALTMSSLHVCQPFKYCYNIVMCSSGQSPVALPHAVQSSVHIYPCRHLSEHHGALENVVFHYNDIFTFYTKFCHLLTSSTLQLAHAINLGQLVGLPLHAYTFMKHSNRTVTKWRDIQFHDELLK